MCPSSTSGQLFVETLASNNEIEANIFAFQIGRGQEPSQVTIGGYNQQENVVDGTPIIWHSLANQKYWTLPLTNVELNGYQVQTKASMVIVDTGSSFVVLPTQDYLTVAQMVFDIAGIPFNRVGLALCDDS